MINTKEKLCTIIFIINTNIIEISINQKRNNLVFISTITDIIIFTPKNTYKHIEESKIIFKIYIN